MASALVKVVALGVWSLLLCLVSCAAKPLTVGVVFEGDWKILGRNALTDREKSLVKNTALRTLRDAYRGFGVRFSEASSGDRLIKVGDTPYVFSSPGMYVGAVGMTYAVATVSSVRLDALYSAELAVARCQDIIGCDSKTREQLLEGLGRGVGATGAHELGHQAGFYFSGDAPCDDCYDGHTANTYIHFFGTKHWSNDALAKMRRVLPSDGSLRGE